MSEESKGTDKIREAIQTIKDEAYLQGYEDGYDDGCMDMVDDDYLSDSGDIDTDCAWK